jgi:hypothetical protein
MFYRPQAEKVWETLFNFDENNINKRFWFQEHFLVYRNKLTAKK